MPSRILVRLPNWLGDALLARPLLHALRTSFPAAQLGAVAPAPLLDLLAGGGVLDARYPWPRDPAARSGLVRELRAWGAETALVLPPSFSSAWFAWRCGARVRIGYAHEGRRLLLTRALARPARGERHLSDEYLELGRELGATAVPTPRLEAAAGAAGAAAARLERAGVPPGTRFALLGPGAIYGPAKRWPAPRFAEVGRGLVARGLVVIVCGTSAEAAGCAEVARGIGPGAVDLSGVTGLPELTGIAAAARLAVCNDSGLAHLSAALGVPTVVVFGSTSSAWTAPLGECVRVVQRPPVCSPCFAPTCRVGYACLAAVTVAHVARACDEVLGARAA